MANGGRIDYTIGFNIDKAGLDNIKRSLEEVRSLTTDDMLRIDKSNNIQRSTNQVKDELSSIKTLANQVEAAFNDAFNPTTNIINLQKLNTSLQNLGGIQNISNTFAKAGQKGQEAFYQITKGALTTNMQLRESNTLLDKMGQTFANTIKWSISSSIINQFVGAIQQAFGYVQHLDTSLNDIRIVTGKSADEMERFAVKANDAAKALGASTTEYTEASLIYYQQGLGDEEAQARAETTIKAANVTGQTGREVSEELTAVWNGYKVTAEETEEYVDKLAAVAATTASNLAELSTGMSKVASAANNMGVNVDQLNGMLATIISVTRQAPETAGTALKTIFARMEDLKISGEDEYGVKLGTVSGTLSQVGVEIMDTAGNMRELGDVIEEVGNKWDSWTRAQQSAIAQSIAGKRQYNNLLALFDNWSMYNKAVETSEGALGTLQKQQDTYMESTAAHIQQLKTQWEELYNTVLDTKDLNSAIDLLTDFINVFTRFIDGIGGGRNALLMLGSTAATVFSKQISAGITHAIQSFTRMKDNAVELQTQLNNIQAFKATQQYQSYEPVKVLVDSLEEASKYYKILNNDQINYANSLAQETAEAKKLELEWEKNVEALEKYHNAVRDSVGKNNILSESFNRTDTQQTIARDSYLQKTLDAVEDFNNEKIGFPALETSIQKINKQFDELNSKGGAVVKTFNEVGRENKKLATNIENFRDHVNATIDTFNDLNNKKVFQNVDPQILNRLSIGLDKLARAEGPVEADEIIKQLMRDATKAGDAAESFLNKMLNVNNSLSTADFSGPFKKLQAFLQEAQIQNSINNLVNGFAALGQFGSALTSLSHSFDVVGDSSLTTKEKVVQFISSFGMGISMLISSLTRLPMLLEGLNAIPKAFNLIDLAFKSWTGSINKVVGAEKVLASMNDEEIKTLYQRLGIQQAVNEELTEESAEIIFDTAVKEGNIAATEHLNKSSLGLKTILTGLNPVILGVTIAITALTLAVAASAKAQQQAAKHAMEDAQTQYKASQEKAEAINQEYENIKKLIDAYQELREEYDASQVDALKRRIFELSQEYDVHIDMVQLMNASYEELDEIMDKLLQDISGEKTTADLEVLNDHLEAIVAEMKSIQADENHPIIDLFLKLSSLIDNIQLKWHDFVEDLTGIDVPDWVMQITSILGTMNYGIVNPIGVLSKGVRSRNAFNLKNSGENVQGVISMSSSGTLEFDEEKFAKYTKEQQDDVLKWLEVNYSENEGLINSALNIIDRSSSNIEKAIRDTSESRSEYANEYSAAQKQYASNWYLGQYGSEGVSNISEYETAKKELADVLAKDLQMDETEALELAKQTLEEDTSYRISGGAAILDTLKTDSASSFSDEELDLVSKKLGTLSDSQTNFISRNIDLINSLHNSGKTVEEIFDNLSTDLDYLSHQDHVINIDTVLNGKKNSKDYKESVDALFNDESFNIGISKEEFDTLDEAQQKYHLILARRKEIEEFQSKEQTGNEIINERNEALQQEIDRYTELIQKEKEQQVLEESKNAVVDKQREQYWTEDNTGLGVELFDWDVDKDKEKIDQFKEDYFQALEQIQQRYDELTKSGVGSYSAIAMAMEEIEDPNVLKYLEAYGLQLSRNSDFTISETDATIDLVKSYRAGSKVVSDHSEKIEEYNEKLEDLYSQQEQATESTYNYVAAMQDGYAAIDEMNKNIDNLQKSYQSMQGIVEDYNDDQLLTLDNLKALIALPTEYAAALDIQNGQMSINDALMREQLDMYIMEQKALVTDTYLNELDAIAKNQVAVASIEATAEELRHQAAINGTIDAAQRGYDALMNYARAKSAAFEVNPAAAEQATKAYYNKMQMIDSLANQSTSSLLGKASSGSSKSGSASKPKEEKHLEREVDLYREINAQLKQIEATLKRIQKENSYKWGKDLQKGLERENKLIDKQLAKLKQKKKMQEKDLSQQRANLESQGINFSKDGSSMKNAESKLDELYATYNSMVDKYNSMTADQQESYKNTLDSQKEYIDKIEKAIDKYESTFSDYQSTLDDLLDAHYAEIENAVNSFNNMVDVHLELDEAHKEWDDFWYEVVQDVQDTDFAGKIAQSMAKLKTLIGFGDEAAESTIATLTNHLEDTVNEVQKQISSRKRGGEDSLFGDATKLSKENLEKYRDALMDALREAKEEVDNISDNYLKMLDSAQELLDKQVAGWEAISDHIEHNAELIKLINGEDAFAQLNKQYDKLYYNNLKLLNTQKQGQDFWAGEIKRYEDLLKVTDKNTVQWKTYSEGLKKASENYQKAVADLDKTVEKALKDLETWRKNQVDSITDTLDRAMTGNLGLDSVEEEWKLINDLSDKYLDNVERAYSIEEYTLDLNDAANAIGLSAANQEKLNKFRDEELRKLNEKEKLTQYDIDESRARLEILKQEMALEDARNNKSNLRLRRDSQGNYTYQFTGNEEDEEAGERGMLTAKKAWYELVKKRYKETADWIIELQKQQTTLHQEIADAEAVGDTERANKLRELYETNARAIQDAYAEAGKNVQDIYSGVAQYFADVNEGTILPTSETTVRTLIDQWADKGEMSFIGAVKSAIVTLDGVQEQYVYRTVEILDEAGIAWQDLTELGLDPTIEALEDLVDTNEDLADQLDEINNLLTEEEQTLRSVEDAYNSLKDAAVDAIQAANDALDTLAQTAIDTQNQVAAAVASAQAAANASSASGSGSGGGSSGSSEINGGTVDTGYHLEKPSDTPTYSGLFAIIRNSDGKEMERGTIKDLQKNWKGKVKGLKSGGYTGEWARGIPGTDNGRLAILHQKELVLNETDTSNLLKAIYTLREMVAAKTNTSGIADQLVAAGNAQAQILAQVGTGILSSLASITTENANTSYRNMTVNADFSGVRSADAIYQALMELENYGMQNSYSVAPHMNTSF